jgi:uncharacterized repeat protein (TIGR04076 family)
MDDHQFTLHNLQVDTIEGDKPFVCNHKLGKAFELRGENLFFEREFSIYSLAALLPLLPAKQRILNEYDWMATDHIIACPDPHCGARFKISRTGKQTFTRSETTIEPLPDNNPWKG